MKSRQQKYRYAGLSVNRQARSSCSGVRAESGLVLDDHHLGDLGRSSIVHSDSVLEFLEEFLLVVFYHTISENEVHCHEEGGGQFVLAQAGLGRLQHRSDAALLVQPGDLVEGGWPGL